VGCITIRLTLSTGFLLECVVSNHIVCAFPCSCSCVSFVWSVPCRYCLLADVCARMCLHLHLVCICIYCTVCVLLLSYGTCVWVLMLFNVASYVLSNKTLLKPCDEPNYRPCRLICKPCLHTCPFPFSPTSTLPHQTWCSYHFATETDGP